MKKLSKSLSLLLLFYTTEVLASNKDNYTHAMKLVEQSLKDIIETPTYSEEKINKYFSSEYVQYVDGKSFNFEEFKLHLAKQKKLITKANIKIERIIGQDNKVSTIHIVKAKKNDGSEVEVQVNAFFEVKNNKIVLVDELTHLIKGNKEDKELGSVK